MSVGSCTSSSAAAAPTTAGKKTFQDATRPSPCDVAAFVPVTPCRSIVGRQDEGVYGVAEAVGRGGAGGAGAPMSPVSRAGGGGVDVLAPARNKAREGGAARGRFATDFEVKEVIGTGGFGTVYKVRPLGGVCFVSSLLSPSVCYSFYHSLLFLPLSVSVCFIILSFYCHSLFASSLFLAIGRQKIIYLDTE